MDSRTLGDPGTSAFALERYPFYQLNRTVSRYNAVIEARLRSIGLDVPNWRVLMILGERAPRSVGEIAQAAVINLSTMMRIVQRMARDGLVRLAARQGDGRVREVFLTEKGETTLAAARDATSPVYAAAIAGFSEGEFDQMLALLGRMHGNLGDVEG